MITAKELKGIVTPIVTPITSDDEVDVKAVGRLVEFQLDGGVSGIFVCGSSGEFPAMTFEDRRIVARAVVEAVSRRVPVLVGCAATGLREVIQHAKIAYALGADAAVVTAPYYFKYSQGEMVEFFRAIASGSRIPIVAYNIPQTTGTTLEVPTILKLSEIKGIIGLKDSSTAVGPLSEVLQGLKGRKDFAVFQGHERVVAVSVLMGASGGVLGLANVAPRLCAELYKAAKAEDLPRAFRLQEKLNELFKLFTVVDPSRSSISTGIGGMKTPLELMGLCSRRPFPPATVATAEHARKMAEICRRVGIKVRR
jgi:4-hydroxy-tetrahydrodipicolinate synthase